MSYWQQVKTRLQGASLTILDLLNSKKFWMAVSGAWLTWETTGNGLAAVGPVIGYVLAQGIADIGKAKAEIEATKQSK